MSDAIILQAVVTKLKELDIWDDNNCKARIDGQPDPIMGNLFCSVYLNEHQTNSQSTDGQLEELFGFAVTITKRIEAVPFDRVPEGIYLDNLSGLSSSFQKTLLHLEYSKLSTVRLMNTLLEDLYETETRLSTQFMTPYRFLYRQAKPVIQNEDWMHGTHSDPDRDRLDGPVAMSLTAYFGGLMLQTLFVEEDCT